MIGRLVASADDVEVVFDGLTDAVEHADIVDTTPRGSDARSFNLILRGVPDTLHGKALAAATASRVVIVRVLGYEASWIVRQLTDNARGTEVCLSQTGALKRL